MPKESLYIMLVAVRIWNSHKLQFTHLHELFDPACSFALLERFEVFGCSITVDSSVGNYQINRFSVVTTGQQAGLCDALAAEPAINEKCSISIWGVKIARTAPLKDLIKGEFVAANKIDHLWVTFCYSKFIQRKRRSTHLYRANSMNMNSANPAIVTV